MNRETRIILISPESDMTPDQVARTIHAMGRDITIKETCYGSAIEGPKEEIRDIVDKIRELDHNAIFSKVRAYPVGDPRRCRAQHGTRPGFAQLEYEWKDLGKIQHGLDCMDRGEKADPERPKPKKLDVNEFKRICEVSK